jgi:hypothetical protein
MHPSAPGTANPQAESSPARATGDGDGPSTAAIASGARDVSLIPVLEDNYVFVLHGAGSLGRDGSLGREGSLGTDGRAGHAVVVDPAVAEPVKPAHEHCTAAR